MQATCPLSCNPCQAYWKLTVRACSKVNQRCTAATKEKSRAAAAHNNEANASAEAKQGTRDQRELTSPANDARWRADCGRTQPEMKKKRLTLPEQDTGRGTRPTRPKTEHQSEKSGREKREACRHPPWERLEGARAQGAAALSPKMCWK